MSSLYVLLPLADSAGELPYVTSADGRTPLEHGRAAPALLPQARGAGAEVVAVVPVQALSWHRVELPRGVTPQSPRLRAALEGLLEEQLLDEPDALHLALQAQARGGDMVWVAACQRTWLRQAVQALEQAGRPVSRIVPEFAPQDTLALHAIGEPDEGWWVAVTPEGVVTAPLATSTVPLLPTLAEDTPCDAEPAVAAAAEQALQRKLQLLQAPQRWLDAAQSGWDLAQFELASSGRARAFKKLSTGWAGLLRAPEWRPARWALALLVLVHLAGLNAWAWKERSALQAKREAIQRTLTTSFPQVKVVVDARVQMERELATLRQSAGATSGRDLESLLAVAAQAVPPGRSPAGLEYNGTELRVRGLGLTPDEATALAASLKGQGYSGTLQGDVLVVAQEDVR